MSQQCINIALPTGQKRNNLDFFDAPQAEESSVSPMLGKIINKYVKSASKIGQKYEKNVKIRAMKKKKMFSNIFDFFYFFDFFQMISQSLRRLLQSQKPYKQDF